MDKKETLTRSDLAEALMNEFIITKSSSLNIVESVLELIVEGLKKERLVKISGFGVFSVRDKKERLARNPRTGEVAVVSPRKVVSFKVSRKLKSVVNNPTIN